MQYEPSGAPLLSQEAPTPAFHALRRHEWSICLGLQKPDSPATSRLGALTSKTLHDQALPSQSSLPGACDLAIRLLGSKKQRTNQGGYSQREVLEEEVGA